MLKAYVALQTASMLGMAEENPIAEPAELGSKSGSADVRSEIRLGYRSGYRSAA